MFSSINNWVLNNHWRKVTSAPYVDNYSSDECWLQVMIYEGLWNFSKTFGNVFGTIFRHKLPLTNLARRLRDPWQCVAKGPISIRSRDLAWQTGFDFDLHHDLITLDNRTRLGHWHCHVHWPGKVQVKSTPSICVHRLTSIRKKVKSLNFYVSKSKNKGVNIFCTHYI